MAIHHYANNPSNATHGAIFFCTGWFYHTFEKVLERDGAPLNERGKP